MNLAPSAQHEILLSLAEEIRQTVVWLQEQDQPPPDHEIRQRIMTLREAAKVAGMNAVEAVLDKTDQELDGNEDEEVSSRTGQVLNRLSDMVASLVGAAEQKELAWLETLQASNNEIVTTHDLLGNSIARLSETTLLVDACASASSQVERSRLLGELGRSIRQELQEQGECIKRLEKTMEGLQGGLDELVRELSGLHAVSLTPVLVHLQENARNFGRKSSRPVSLHTRCVGLRIGVRQVDPLERVLTFLVNEALEQGLESPQERRKTGKPTVGSIRITADSGKSLLVFHLEDDGRSPRPEPKLPREIQKDLDGLRARLVRNTPTGGVQGYLLQIPPRASTLEVIRVRTPVGEVLVPLSVIGEVFTGKTEDETSLPVVSLARRATDDAAAGNGLVFEVAGWQGVMYAEILSGHHRVVPSPPQEDDPAWVIGRVCDRDQVRLILHPLPFIEVEEEQLCLYPALP